jgi:exosortase A-associated hydrolase 1
LIGARMGVHSTLREAALVFGCEGDDLVGVLHCPAEEARAPVAVTGVVVIVGGPQYRVGSHRQFVHLGRGFARAGFATLRFDYRGMGDSTGARRDFEAVSKDIGSALDALQAAQPQIRRFVLWGLCDGASAILLYLHERADPRVAAVILANPWVRSAQSLAGHTEDYYLQRLTQKTSGSNSFGKSRPVCAEGCCQKHDRSDRTLACSIDLQGSGAVLPRSDQGSSFQARMAQGLRLFGGKTLLLLSENDYTARSSSSSPHKAPIGSLC